VALEHIAVLSPPMHGTQINLRDTEAVFFLRCNDSAAHCGEVSEVAIGAHAFSIPRQLVGVCKKAREFLIEGALPAGIRDEEVNESEFGDNAGLIDRDCRRSRGALIPWQQPGEWVQQPFCASAHLFSKEWK
jgi:hypothetical protein